MDGKKTTLVKNRACSSNKTIMKIWKMISLPKRCQNGLKLRFQQIRTSQWKSMREFLNQCVMRKFLQQTTRNTALPFLRNTIRIWFQMLQLLFVISAASSSCKMNMNLLILRKDVVRFVFHINGLLLANSERITRKTKVSRMYTAVWPILITDEAL